MPDGEETIIIGAGAAGLATAANLADRGHSALVLEARDRIGGRIWCRHEPGLGTAIELGAEFIHGYADATVAWLKRAGRTPIATADSHWSLRDGKLQQRDSVFGEIQQKFKQFASASSNDLSLDDFLSERLSGELSAEACAYVRMMAEGFDAADTSRVSSRWIVDEWTSDAMTNAPQSRPDGGYSGLLHALAAALPDDKIRVRLQSIVRSVRWQRGKVVVEGDCLGVPFRHEAKRCVITLPLGVLQLADNSPHAVRFFPPLASKRQAIEGLGYGPVIKLNLKFQSAFWEGLENGRFRDAAFFHASECPVPTFWTSVPHRSPLLVAWAGGPHAARLSSGGGLEHVTEQALLSLEHLFGKNADVRSRLDGVFMHDWLSDPFAMGAYTYVAVGGGQAHAQLAQPIDDTLFFAGEATDSSGEAATVTGALSSGERAARSILDA